MINTEIYTSVVVQEAFRGGQENQRRPRVWSISKACSKAKGLLGRLAATNSQTLLAIEVQKAF